MRIAMTGASGLIGSAVTRVLRDDGHDVVAFTRSDPGPREAHWRPTGGQIDRETLASCQAVIHLAGESIGSGRWTPERKRRIRDSRVEGTRLLANTMAELEDGPRVLLSASAVGYYGDRGAQELTEESAAGDGFLARVCRDWEDATSQAEDAGVRVVHVRTGVVLSPKGGALQRQLPIHKLGLGAQLGSGEQYWPWVTLVDVAGLYRFLLTEEEARGPVNATAPNPVTNVVFTRTLNRVLHRPTFPVAVPQAALRLALSELADALLFFSQRVIPERAERLGYRWQHTELETGLRAVLDGA